MWNLNLKSVESINLTKPLNSSELKDAYTSIQQNSFDFSEIIKRKCAGSENKNDCCCINKKTDVDADENDKVQNKRFKNRNNKSSLQIIVRNKEMAIQMFIQQVNSFFSDKNSKLKNQVHGANAQAMQLSKRLNGSDAELREVYIGIYKATQSTINEMNEFVKNLPGLREIVKNKSDLAIMINHRLFDYYLVFYLFQYILAFK